MAYEKGSRRAIVFALLANLGVALIKLVAAFYTHSAAMMAEGIHSVADAGNQVLLWLGYRLSRRSPDPYHPFGYGKEQYFWSFIVSLLLFTLGGLYSIYEGVSKLIHPHAVFSPVLNIGILLAAMVMEGISWGAAVSALTPEYRSPRAFIRFARRTKAPALLVVIFEDSAALVGLLAALFGTVLSMATDNPRFDAMASLVIGILLVVVAGVLARETRSLLIGEGLEPERVRAVLERIRPRVKRVIEFRSLYMGPGVLLIGMTLGVEPGISHSDFVAEVERNVRAIVPEAKYIYVEVIEESDQASA